MKFEKKAAYLEEHGYEITGYIFTHPETGKRALMDHGRVVWYEKDAAELVPGHKEPEADLDAVPCVKPYLTEGKTRSNIKTPKRDGRRPPPPPPPIPPADRVLRDDEVPPPPPPPPKRVFKEEAPGAESLRAFRARTIAWLRKYRVIADG